MKRNTFFTGLIAFLLAVSLSLSSVGCIVTGFRLQIGNWPHLIGVIVIFAAVFALLLSFRRGAGATVVLLLLGFAMSLHWGDLLLSAEKLLSTITKFYDGAYGWGYIRWSQSDLSAAKVDTALIVIACLVAPAVCWTVIRKKWFGFGLLAGLLPLVSCCIVTDTIPADSWLWLLITALLLLTLTQRLRRMDPRDANRLTALLLIPVILFSSLLFRLSPAEGCQPQAQALQNQLLFMAQKLSTILPGGWIEIPGGSAGLPSISGQVDLSGAGPIDLGDSAVMHVTPRYSSGTLYLRGKAYDRYTGTQWQATINTKNEGGWAYGGMERYDTIQVKTLLPIPIRYFSYAPWGQDWLPYLQNGALVNTGSDPSSYTIITAVEGDPDKRKVQPLTEEEKQAYLQLPDETLEEAQKLLKEIGITDNMSPVEIRRKVASYVKNSAQYDQSTGAMPANTADFALWFLEESDTGYCVHFASAATVLLRAAGIPARYVTGYMTSVQAHKTCVVTASQAHAWVEYLDPQHGWTHLETTPTSPSDVIIAPTEPPVTTVPTESAPTVPPTETIAPTETTTPTETTAPTVSTQPSQIAPTAPSGGPQSTENTADTVPSEETQPAATEPPAADPSDEPIRLNLHWIRGILWVLAIWAFFAGQYKLRILLRKKWLQKGDRNRQCLKRWHYVRRISRLSGLSAAELLPLAEKAAYSQHTLTDEELAQFDQWLLRANEALLQRSWLRQFVLRLIFAIE